MIELEFASKVLPDHRSIYAPTLFTRRMPLAASFFIKAMHPKTEILPEPSAVARILKNGWVGQTKIHGHRAQIHVPAEDSETILLYTRQGTRHRQALTSTMDKELRRLFRPEKGWNVIDAEWLKPEKKIFVFDFLKKDGKSLMSLTFLERWELLPKAFISPHISVLPVFWDLEACLKVLQSDKKTIEGLVFKSIRSTGFKDSSIVRCRKKK